MADGAGTADARSRPRCSPASVAARAQGAASLRPAGLARCGCSRQPQAQTAAAKRTPGRLHEIRSLSRPDLRGIDAAEATHRTFSAAAPPARSGNRCSPSISRTRWPRAPHSALRSGSPSAAPMARRAAPGPPRRSRRQPAPARRNASAVTDTRQGAAVRKRGRWPQRLMRRGAGVKPCRRCRRPNSASDPPAPPARPCRGGFRRSSSTRPASEPAERGQTLARHHRSGSQPARGSARRGNRRAATATRPSI